MATPSIFNKASLSGSTNGLGIKIAATATPGTAIHTAVAGTTANTFDEIWMWAVNSDTTARKLTVEYGGVTVPDHLIEVTVPPESGLFLIVPGFLIENGQNIKAFCATADVVVIYGYVNEVRP